MNLHPGPETAVGSPRAFAFPAFLLSLLVPGLGQLLLGRTARALVLLGLAATAVAAVLGGLFRLPPIAGFDGRDVVGTSLLMLLWGFAAYDAWFAARERNNGMLPHLPRTPRVAAFADLAWGGAGHAYRGRREGPTLMALTALPAAAVAMTGHLAAAAVLLAWNGILAARSWLAASRLYHGAPAYRALERRLAQAPFASSWAPSPSLPLATLVAVFIAVVGGLILNRTLDEMKGPPAAGPLTGRVENGRFSDASNGIGLALPAGGWSFAPAPRPRILSGVHVGTGETFSLAIAAHPLFSSGDFVPPGALERFAAAQTGALERGVPGYALVESRPMRGAGRDGLRLVFRSRPGGRDTLTVQDFLVRGSRILILTLSGPAQLGTGRLADGLEAMAAGLSTEGPQT